MANFTMANFHCMIGGNCRPTFQKDDCHVQCTEQYHELNSACSGGDLCRIIVDGELDAVDQRFATLTSFVCIPARCKSSAEYKSLVKELYSKLHCEYFQCLADYKPCKVHLECGALTSFVVSVAVYWFLLPRTPPPPRVPVHHHTGLEEGQIVLIIIGAAFIGFVVVLVGVVLWRRFKKKNN